MRILHDSAIDIIIGRDSIKKYVLAISFPQFFFSEAKTVIGSTDHKMAVSSDHTMIPITTEHESVKNHSQWEDAGNTDGSRTAQPATRVHVNRRWFTFT